MSISPNLESPNKPCGPYERATTNRSSIYFMIMLFNYIPGNPAVPEITAMARHIITPRQLLPCGYNPPVFTPQLDLDIESDMIRFIVLCRPSSEEERRTGRLCVSTTTTLWDTPNQDLAIMLYDHLVGVLTGPDLIHPFRSFTSSESTGLTLFSVNYRDITIINRITTAIRRTVIDGMCFESFPVDIFDGVWAETRQLEIVSEWYLINYSFPETSLFPTITFYPQDYAHCQCCGLALQPSGAPVHFFLNKLLGRNTNPDRKEQLPIGKLTNLIQLCISPSCHSGTMMKGYNATSGPSISWKSIMPPGFQSLLRGERNHKPRINMLPFYIFSSRGMSTSTGWSVPSGETLQAVAARATIFTKENIKTYGNIFVTDMLLLVSSLQPGLLHDILLGVTMSLRGETEYRAVQANLIVMEEVMMSPTTRYGGYVKNSSYYTNPLFFVNYVKQFYSANPVKQVHLIRTKGFSSTRNICETQDTPKPKENLPPKQVITQPGPDPGRNLTNPPRRTLFGDHPPFPPRTWGELMPGPLTMEDR